MRAGMGLLLGLGAAAVGVTLWKASEAKAASTAPTPGTPVPVYGPNGAIIGYVTPTGIYPNQAPGGPVYTPPLRRIETAGCVACGGALTPRYYPNGELIEECVGCEEDYQRMRHLTQSVALAGAFR